MDIDAADYDRWNKAVAEANRTYVKRMHNICCDNCHSHVARALNNFRYKGRDNYTMVDIWWMLITRGKYVNWGAVVYTYFLYVVGFFVFLFFYSAPK